MRLSTPCIRSSLVLLFGLTSGSLADDWPSIPAEELNLKDSPTHPGAAAIVLYREEYADDSDSYARYHMRIKILTEEGKKYADVDIPFWEDWDSIRDLEARTVRADGTSVPFPVQVFEKPVAKGSGIDLLTKTFTFPEVQVGSILEYRYRKRFNVGFFQPRWIIQLDLPTLRAVFVRKPSGFGALRCVTSHLPPGVAIQEDKDKRIRLEFQDIPPFHEEEFMPPRNELVWRVDFHYITELESTEQYWRRIGKERWKHCEEFIGKHGDIAREAAAVIGADDPAETRLRKLYARARRVRNLTYDHPPWAPKENHNTKDVLKNGYGHAWEINCLFVALARAAGCNAEVAYLAPRAEFFFSSNRRDPDQLAAFVAVVQLDSQSVFLDPSSRFSAYGQLSWPQTGVSGIRLDREGGTFVTSPQPRSGDAVVVRVARLELREDGSLQGLLQVTFRGLEALTRREDNDKEPSTARKKVIEAEIKGWLPAAAAVEIDSIENWENWEEPLRARCSVKVPNVATVTDQRILLPTAIFQLGRSHPFQHAQRVHPVYFAHPFQEQDSITVKLPVGVAVENAPSPRTDAMPFGRLETRFGEDSSTVNFFRLLSMDRCYFGTELYPALHAFYDRVRSADEDRFVLRKTQHSPDH